MGWTNPNPVTTGQVITAAKWNEELIDNLLYLKTRPHWVIKQVGESNITVNWSTFAELSPSLNLSVYITEDNTPLHVHMAFAGYFSATVGTGAMMALDFLIDGTVYASNNTATPKTRGLWHVVEDSYEGVTFPRWHQLDFYLTGLTKGTHTLRPYVSTNYTYIVNRALYDLTFMAKEMV